MAEGGKQYSDYLRLVQFAYSDTEQMRNIRPFLKEAFEKGIDIIILHNPFTRKSVRPFVQRHKYEYMIHWAGDSVDFKSTQSVIFTKTTPKIKNAGGIQDGDYYDCKITVNAPGIGSIRIVVVTLKRANIEKDLKTIRKYVERLAQTKYFLFVSYENEVAAEAEQFLDQLHLIQISEQSRENLKYICLINSDNRDRFKIDQTTQVLDNNNCIIMDIRKLLEGCDC